MLACSFEEQKQLQEQLQPKILVNDNLSWCFSSYECETEDNKQPQTFTI